MAAQDDARVAGEPVPQRVEVRRAAVGALAVAGAVPEGDAAVALRARERAARASPPAADAAPCGACEFRSRICQPAMRALRPGRLPVALAAGPVGVVAREAVAPLVVAGRGHGDAARGGRSAGGTSAGTRFACRSRRRRRGRGSRSGPRAADERGDPVGVPARRGGVADGPDDGARALGAGDARPASSPTTAASGEDQRKRLARATAPALMASRTGRRSRGARHPVGGPVHDLAAHGHRRASRRRPGSAHRGRRASASAGRPPAASCPRSSPEPCRRPSRGATSRPPARPQGYEAGGRRRTFGRTPAPGANPSARAATATRPRAAECRGPPPTTVSPSQVDGSAPRRQSPARTSARLRGSAVLRRKRAASPVPVSSTPSRGTPPCPGGRTLATIPSRTMASTPPSRGRAGAVARREHTSSLASVQVSTAFGRMVGTSPPRPPHAGISPRVRSIPSISRDRPFTVTRPLNARGAITRRPLTGPHEQRAAAVDRLAEQLAVDREHAHRVAARCEVAAVHAGHGTHAAAHRAHALAAGDPLVREHAANAARGRPPAR